jgi:parallel beta-helix repeat protein
MTTFYVHGLDGSNGAPGTSDAPLKTIQAAISMAAPGDTILVRDGTYHESVTVSKRLTIRADEGHAPEVDGGYGPHLFGDAAGFTGYDGKPVAAGRLPSPTAANIAKGGWLPTQAATNIYAPLVNVTADDATWEGITVRNSAGRGIQATANRVTVRDSHIDFCYAGCVWAGGASNAAKSTGVVIEGCTVTRGSMRAFDPTRAGAGTSMMGVDSCLVLKFTTNPIVEGNVVAYNFAEGIWIGYGVSGAVIRSNIAQTNLNESLYVNGGGTDCEIVGNYCFPCDNLIAEMSKAAPLKPYNNVMLGDEESNWQSGPDLTMMDNIIVGGEAAASFEIGAWSGTGIFPRPYQLNRAYIGFNTFIGGQFNDRAVSFGSRADKPHKDSLFENNVILAYPGKPIATATNYGGGYGDVVFRNNLSNQALPPQQVGTASKVSSGPILKDPYAPIHGTFTVDSLELPNTATTFDPANYAPVDGGAAWGMASDGKPSNGVTPPVTRNFVGAWIEVDEPEPDPDPEPEPAPDLEPLFVALAEKLQALQGHLGAATDALSDVGAAYVELWNAWDGPAQEAALFELEE